ncbi:TetR/AcrR family transcriptional regulator [Streptomyces sp. t39]|uniref:TetR/AcrR family transcriptional regulator n=1 Tax=Streptomyces sp. t39 TaxID=1828156 RepID=UPI0011CDC4C9|nr:TetR/AcrR family transcriptional regulator [Streptomyces sp. t39]TXS56827.1 TetR family transcriptional regulator [Streptomyces sp. t39]
MPAAREALLDAALAALRARPWSGVRMVEVAASAGVSRQTLHNEFGGKDGLARALVRREVEDFLRGAGRLFAECCEGEGGGGGEGAGGGGDGVERCVRLAQWTVERVTDRPLLRALLTGCWGERVPLPRASRGPGPGRLPVDAGPPAPAELLAALRTRLGAVPAARAPAAPGGLPPHAYELAVRLAVSHVLAPADEGVPALVRSALGAVGRPAR